MNDEILFKIFELIAEDCIMNSKQEELLWERIIEKSESTGSIDHENETNKRELHKSCR